MLAVFSEFASGVSSRVCVICFSVLWCPLWVPHKKIFISSLLQGVCISTQVFCVLRNVSIMWCPLRFQNETMFGSSLPPVVCSRTDVLFMLYLFVYSGAYTLWLCESHSWCRIRGRNCLPFTNTWVHPRFLMGSMLCILFSVLCFFRIVPCVPNNAIVCGLSILDCPSISLTFI